MLTVQEPVPAQLTEPYCPLPALHSDVLRVSILCVFHSQETGSKARRNNMRTCRQLYKSSSVCRPDCFFL